MKKITICTTCEKPVTLLMALLILGSLQGCMYYYKVETVKPVSPQEVKEYDKYGKYLIVHQRDKAWHFSNCFVSDSAIYGELTVLPENRYKFLTTKPTGGNRYKKREDPNESYVLEEVHLYVSDSVVPENHTSGTITIDFRRIRNVEAYVKDKGRTNASWLVPAIGGGLLTGGIVAAIIVVAVGEGMGSMHLSMK